MRSQTLGEAPAFTLNLATGDSLLHGPLPTDGATMLFDANRINQNVAHVYETEDAGELKGSSGSDITRLSETRRTSPSGQRVA